MKVKGIMFSGFAAAILMGTVDANAALNIASQAYVDNRTTITIGGEPVELTDAVANLVDSDAAGAKAAAAAAQADVDALELVVGDATTGLAATKTIADGAASAAQANASAIQTINSSAPMNSGITADKVATYDGYAATISSKASQSDLTSLEGRVAANENIISTTGQTIPSTIGSTTNVATIVGAINALNTKTEGIASSDTVSGINTRLETAEGKITTAESDIDALESSVNDATTGLAATNTLANNNKNAIDAINDATNGIAAVAASTAQTKANAAEQNAKDYSDTKFGGGTNVTGLPAYSTCTGESGKCVLAVSKTNGALEWVEVTSPLTSNN